ncbi:unnamed protein product [Cylicostephanus goldi]|uniref:EndoU domain-containing protein n=1 Tax=Cylicostephanus goldi TaxID=71465 RepID=A0A3P7PQA0_CYLGO|nr:unnamed protein product [Cylicostephanus goldi]
MIFLNLVDIDQSLVTQTLNSLVQKDTRLDADTTINYQNMASHKDFTHDNAAKPLFTSVVQSAISGSTYKALENLIAFYNQPDVDKSETMTPAWETSISAFLDVIIQTTVMQSEFKGSSMTIDKVSRKPKIMTPNHGLSSPNVTLFKNQLQTLWFTLYARDTVAGSSGFEALFVGETKANNVIRFGNWLQFYNQEKAGNINYHGFFQKENVCDLFIPRILR